MSRIVINTMLPPWVGSLVGNTALLMGALCYYNAFADVIERKPKFSIGIAIVVFTFLGLAYFYFIFPKPCYYGNN